jgi:uncharacterized protein YbbK (DUF523 family)/uncharacterized protein YbgA (DUF1722 family)
VTSGGRAGEIRIGVSACLLGERVRYDGGHEKDPFLTGPLAAHVRFVPVCPEVELGLGTPRETIRLQRDEAPSPTVSRGPAVREGAEAPVRLVAPGSGRDHTAAMRRYAERRVAELAGLELSGYVLKTDSPSCGMERVRIWGGGPVPARTGRGAFAEVLMRRLPLLPVEEEGRLRDPALRENFLERVLAYRRVRDLFAGRWNLGHLVGFHAREKLLVLAHDPGAHRKLGAVVARAKGAPRDDIARAYAEAFLRALARPATRGRHASVLRRVAGHLEEPATPDERQALREAIAEYRRGHVHLVVPVTLARHLVRRHRIECLARQRYLDPHPLESMSRNHP